MLPKKGVGDKCFLFSIVTDLFFLPFSFGNAGIVLLLK